MSGRLSRVTLLPPTSSPEHMNSITPAFVALLLLASCTPAIAQQTSPIFVWPDLAPGETDRDTGTTLPMRPTDHPPITRVEKIRRPPMTVYPATKKPNGAAVLILPGGGFGRVVPDLEGSEAAKWLGELGVTSFVLNYRTRLEDAGDEPAWLRPLQDAQRAMRWIRANASRWNLDTNKIGLLAFSAGGQVGSILITAEDTAYESIDAVDEQPFRPDFSMLVYPWRIYDEASDGAVTADQSHRQDATYLHRSHAR